MIILVQEHFFVYHLQLRTAHDFTNGVISLHNRNIFEEISNVEKLDGIFVSQQFISSSMVDFGCLIQELFNRAIGVMFILNWVRGEVGLTVWRSQKV